MDNHQVVAVVGLGYIGLPTAAILATNGVNVIGVDVSDRHVNAVNAGKVPFLEPELGAHVASAVAAGRLRAQKETPHADVYIVAVPTPLKGDHEADLGYIDRATATITPQLRGGELVILESTSPPGTTEHMARRMMAARPDLALDGFAGRPVVQFAHCPERVLPGRVMIELVTNDRIVGGLTRDAATRARDLYRIFCKAEIHITDATTAEMAKLTENAFRDVNIAFANELSIIAERLGIDVFELIELANKHPRVDILQPGPGVGGHCIAVDPWFIVNAAPEESKLIRTARTVNDDKPQYVIDRVNEAIENKNDAVIAVLGLAFKPGIDDMRESPAVNIALRLAEAHPSSPILAVEPNIEELPHQLAGLANVHLSELTEALLRADVVALLVDHREFKDLDVEDRPKVRVIDTRGAWR